MKNLIIYCHPNPKSYNHALLDICTEHLKEGGDEIRIRDLYKMKFDPTLKGSDFEAFMKGEVPADIREEQDQISWAEVVTFIFPIWWFQMPAMLKGYIDRVFSKGFAYDVAEDGLKGLLTGKKINIINTTGGAEDIYDSMGFRDALTKTHEIGIFGVSGMEVSSHRFFFAVPFITDEDRKGMLAQFRDEL